MKPQLEQNGKRNHQLCITSAGHRYQNINWSLTRFGCGSQGRLWLQGAQASAMGLAAGHAGSTAGRRDREEQGEEGQGWASAGPGGPGVQLWV